MEGINPNGILFDGSSIWMPTRAAVHSAKSLSHGRPNPELASGEIAGTTVALLAIGIVGIEVLRRDVVTVQAAAMEIRPGSAASSRSVRISFDLRRRLVHP
jgi:hypothetical protein